MIARVPSLEFLHSIRGLYADPSAQANLRIWSCGYGVAIDLTANKRTILCGVAGAFRQEVECFVHIGLPNVTRTVGKQVSPLELRLTADEPPIEFRFARNTSKGLIVSVLFDGEIEQTYELSAA